ncbi:hypothetical protein DFJ74DRAFT_685939 [Hyaloraphidium curvatum]|nr:hypothetical protein DFJ74DRAFT_685939 [Hyaloraphidium curvatum]
MSGAAMDVPAIADEPSSEADFSPDELAAFGRFAVYPFEKDRVYLQGEAGVRRRAEERWRKDHAGSGEADDGGPGADGAQNGDGGADDQEALRAFIETELVGAKLFYFERMHDVKLDIGRLNTYLALRSSGTLPSSAPPTSSSTSTPTHVFEAFQRYDFSADPGFEAGAAAIRARHPEGRERDDAVEKAKAWYYNRFIQPMDYAEFVAWKAAKDRPEGTAESADGIAAAAEGESAGQTDATSSRAEGAGSEAAAATAGAAPGTQTASSDEPKYPASFMELCQMLAEGKPIPGIREIPNKINEGTPSEAKEAPRKKPWEK